MTRACLTPTANMLQRITSSPSFFLFLYVAYSRGKSIGTSLLENPSGFFSALFMSYPRISSEHTHSRRIPATGDKEEVAS